MIYNSEVGNECYRKRDDMFKRDVKQRKILRKLNKQLVTVAILGGVIASGGTVVAAQTQSEELSQLDPVVELAEDASEMKVNASEEVMDQSVLKDERYTNAPLATDRSKERSVAATHLETIATTELSEKPYRRATIFHTNDIHGRISYQRNSRYSMGFANIQSLADKYRELADEFIMVDAGDTMHGTNEVNLSQGKNAIDLLNALGYSVFTPGNHEYNYGLERLVALTKDKNNTFKTITSNVKYKETDQRVFDAFAEWNVFGQKIGIIGVTAQDTPTTTHPDNVKDVYFMDEVSAVRQEVDALSNQFDHLIALTHVGYDVDRKIATEVNGIDVIIGGHSHTPIIGGKMINDTLIAQAWEYGKMVGLVHLDFDDKGRLIRKTAETLTLDENFNFKDNRGKEENILSVLPSTVLGDVAEIKREQVMPNPKTQAMLDDYKAKLDEQLKKPVGQTAVSLNGARDAVRRRETNLGNLIADALRSFSGAEIGVLNGGAIRASLEAGPLTVGDIITVLPFINTVETINVPGSIIKEALEHSVRLLPNEQNGGFLQVSGMSFVVDVTRPVGERVVAINVGGRPIDAQRVYSLTTSDFTLAGGDGYHMFKAYKVANVSGELFSDAVIRYIRNHSAPIEPGIDGRIVISEVRVTERYLEQLGFAGSASAAHTVTGQTDVLQPGRQLVASRVDGVNLEKTKKVIVSNARDHQVTQQQAKTDQVLPNTATGVWIMGLMGVVTLVSGAWMSFLKR